MLFLFFLYYISPILFQRARLLLLLLSVQALLRLLLLLHRRIQQLLCIIFAHLRLLLLLFRICLFLVGLVLLLLLLVLAIFFVLVVLLLLLLVVFSILLQLLAKGKIIPRLIVMRIVAQRLRIRLYSITIHLSTLTNDAYIMVNLSLTQFIGLHLARLLIELYSLRSFVLHHQHTA